MSGEVLAADRWSTNGELIADIARLGYLRKHDVTVDPTYEKGTWWNCWRPDRLTIHHRAVDGSDFRHLPHPSASFGAAAYDPPYVCPGGRETSTLGEMHARYGMNEGGAADPDFRNPAELQEIMNDGLTEMRRIVIPSAVRVVDPVRPNGVIVMKCQDYVWGGRLWEGTYFVRKHAEALGLVLEDRFEHVGNIRPQPATRKHTPCKGEGCADCGGVGSTPTIQAHARRNLSTAFVFRVLKAPREVLF